MRERITGLSVLLTLLLAPLSGALAGVCHCDHSSVEAAEMSQGSCCAESHKCCYEHNESEDAAPLHADLNQQSRVDFKAAVRQPVQLLPAPAVILAREEKMIHCVGPPGGDVRELSLRQSWLI